MKWKLWIILALAALIVALGANAALADDSGSCGENVTYSFNSNTGVLTISGTGAMTNYTVRTYEENVPWYSYRTQISSIVIESGVTSIGNYTFTGCSIIDLNIPSSVNKIGSSAFINCGHLTTVTVMNPNAVFGGNVFSRRSGTSDLLLKGWANSTAQSYAESAGHPFESLGSLTGACGENVSYSFDPATGELTISGTGRMTDYSSNHDVPWYSYVGDIKSVTIASGVISIGSNAFYGCTSMTSISIPDSVINIGGQAFYACTGLTQVTLPNNVAGIGANAFASCSDLESINIPQGISTIVNWTFAYCTNLTSITIPGNVTRIMNSAFTGCSSLTSVTIWNPDCVIGGSDYGVFIGCPAALTLRGWAGSTAETYAGNTTNPCAFESLGSLTGSCGENVTWAFNPATGVLTISGTGAMGNTNPAPWESYKEEILSIVIENGVTTISARSFLSCSEMTSVIIPDSVTSIGNIAFAYCASLTSVYIPDSVTNIVRFAFQNCNSLTSIHLPNGITEINDGTFANCYELTSVNIPGSVTSIGEQAFTSCYGLTSVTIPSSVASIGKAAFYGCSGLTSAFILNPDCVIDDSNYIVFKGCASGFTLHGWAGSTAETYAANTQNPCGFELLAPAPDFFLPATLTDIESEAFSGIAAQAVVIPKNIQSIAGNPFADSGVLYIYGFPGTAAEALAESDPIRFMFFPLTDAWYTRLTNK